MEKYGDYYRITLYLYALLPLGSFSTLGAHEGCNHAVEIVRVTYSPQGTMIRATIAE